MFLVRPPVEPRAGYTESNVQSKRYPHIVRCTVDGEDGIVKHVEFIPTGETWDLTQTDPMVVAGLLQQDDIALLVEGEWNPSRVSRAE